MSTFISAFPLPGLHINREVCVGGMIEAKKLDVQTVVTEIPLGRKVSYVSRKTPSYIADTVQLILCEIYGLFLFLLLLPEMSL